MDIRWSLAWSVLLVTIMSGQCCLVDETWSTKSTYDLLDMADIVVYGRDTGHVERTGVNMSTRINNVTDCLFQVYCVLKGNATMRDITIEHISPLTGCSGSREKLKVGMEMIVGLKMTKSGNYKYYEGNALQSSVYVSNADNFRTMDNVSSTSEWQAPSDAEEDTCKSAIENVTMTSTQSTRHTSEYPKDTVTMTSARSTKHTSEYPKDTTTVKQEVTTQTKSSAAKIGANLENKENSAGTVVLVKHLFLLTVSVLTVIN